MKVQLRRDTKYFCVDFFQVREILNQIQAEFIIKKQQEDHIFKIYDPETKANSKRIKVRIENEESLLVYVYSRSNQESNIEFDYYQVKDAQILSIFTSLYGQAIKIKKDREVWSKDDVVFHLDTVEGVGKIFEIELLRSETPPTNEDLEGYKQLFQGHLLKRIEGSNEDLIK
ncbi:hypothetical protein DCC39_12365 [Pueribacillus theae]|uniref:CYTH domain-containing protein n=1 Tax=Pueribacillus theae TaxID=2171751 RepID=A0A2U1JX99_9BACI|nr:CYTH domain-containing protein [Pueribacillus theae]PWA09752.1 hypothetical protein DCC39_12365 [Pueribacillus theae]